MGREVASERYTVLVCACLLTFGSYYCFDMPSVLETQITYTIIDKFEPDKGATLYNLFYAVYSWTNMGTSLLAGLLVDKYGVVPAVFLFLSFCFIGQSIWSYGASLESTTSGARFGIMFAGRFIFGMGGGSITIAQNAITAYWFAGRELAMAFGLTLSVARLGSTLNFNLTTFVFTSFAGLFSQRKGLSSSEVASLCSPNQGSNKWPAGLTPTDDDFVSCRKALSSTFWVGSGLIALSFLAALAWRRMHNREQQEANQTRKGSSGMQSVLLDAEDLMDGEGFGVQEKKPRKKMNCSDIKRLPLSYWLCGIIIMSFYNEVFPYMAIGPKLLSSGIKGNHNYGLNATQAGSVTSIVYLMSMFISPFLGRFVDYYGRRAVLAIFGCALGIPAFLLLANTNITPIVPMVLLGFSYCVCASVLWPSIQFLVDPSIIGTANGLATSMQMLGIGVCNIVVGRLMDENTDDATKVTNYRPALLFFAGMACVSTLLSGVLLAVDQTSGGKQLMKGQRDKEKEEAYGLMNNDPLMPDSSQMESPGLNYLASPTGVLGAMNARKAMRSAGQSR